jgi:bacterioferritin
MSFLSDIQDIRNRARQKIEDGPITQDYGLDKERAIGILNEALATEIVCVLRYRFHYYMATGIHSTAVAEEFAEHAKEEEEHAERIAERIKQLGGKPDMNPATLTARSHSEYKEGSSLPDMIREDLIAERIAIESYREIVHFFGDKDPTSRVMMEEILAKEEEHADDLADLLFAIGPQAEDKPRKLYSEDEAPRQSSAQKRPAGASGKPSRR